ncbi:hypothetical protein, partial [Clostridioides difficile]|uniref:hypothetical protein n=1 Tax=Clostridioides difficile TaxID=1496 RepID=UPI002ED00B77
KMAMQAILIIIIIGVLIGTWIVSGVVPCMIYWGLKILSPNIFISVSIGIKESIFISCLPIAMIALFKIPLSS